MDWREVRPDASGLVVMFPCKPASHARDVTLPGAGAVRMTMHACKASGGLYAVLSFDVASPDKVDAALEHLRASALANAGAQQAQAMPRAAPVPGATPYAKAGAWQWQGRTAQGEPAAHRSIVTARAMHLVQATVVLPGATVLPRDEQAVDTFLSSLRWPT